MMKILYSSILAGLLLLTSCTPTKTTKYNYLPPPELKQVDIYFSSIYICVQLVPQSQNTTYDPSYNHNDVKCPDGSRYADMAESSVWLASLMIDKNNKEYRGVFKSEEDCKLLSNVQVTKFLLANPITGFNIIVSCEKRTIDTYDTKLYDVRQRSPFRST